METEHIEEIRRRVLNATKSLLVQNGYKKTTIRRIVEESGVLIGSIYYIFQNKEDIFQSLILAMVEKCIAKIDATWPGEEAAFRFSAVCALELIELEAAPIIRDVYQEGYDSTVVFEHMVGQFVGLAEKVFDGTTLSASREEYYRRVLLLKGAMRAAIAELSFAGEHDSRATRAAVVLLALRLFGVGEEASREVLSRIEAREGELLAIAEALASQPIEA